MPFDYEFVQGLVDFGRGMAGDFVGQPFEVYRLNAASNYDLIDPVNIVNPDLRAKVTHGKRGPVVENEIIHANMYEFLVDGREVEIGDILLQRDQAYNQNAYFAVASKRPLKPVVCIRVNSLCKLYRAVSNRQSGYGGTTRASDQPFVLREGEFIIETPEGIEPTLVPCDLAYIGQIKNAKPSKLPMDTTTTWWYVYVPALPGLQRIRENDVIESQPLHPDEEPDRYRVTGPFVSVAGTQGQFLLCERI